MALAAKPGEATGKRMSVVDAKLSTTHIGAPEHDPTESLQVKRGARHQTRGRESAAHLRLVDAPHAKNRRSVLTIAPVPGLTPLPRA
jgi:hypothetical protein